MLFELLPVALIATAILIVLWTAKAALAPWLGGGRRLRVVARPLMTANELEFCARLRAALPECLVCAQVAMSAIMTHDARLSPTDRLATRNRFDRKIVDFVILDTAGKTVALVELDDRSHSATKDAARDAITGAAGHRTVRFASHPRPTPAAIRAAIVQQVVS